MDAPRTNMYDGTCAKCRNAVAARAGTLVKGATGGYKVFCAACLPRPEASSGSGTSGSAAAPGVGKGTLRISSVGNGRFEVEPVGRLGDSFREFCRIRDGAAVRNRKDEATGKWHSTLGPEPLASLVLALRTAGFGVQLDESAQAAIGERAAAAAKDTAAAAKWIAAVNAKLAERGFSLYSYQIDGVGWIAARRNALLADDMGLGKTVQVLAALPEGAPILIVCPAVAKGVWSREASNWRPDLAVERLKGRGSFRWPEPGQMVVTNFDILPRVEDDGADVAVLDGCPEGLILVVDEIHKCMSSGSDRTKRCRAIGRRVLAKGGRVYGLSATPIQSVPTELWSIFGVLGLQSEAFASFRVFAKHFGGREEEIRGRRGRVVRGADGEPVKHWVWDGNPDDVAAAALKRIMLRRTKDEVLKDLPPWRYQDIEVNDLPDDLRQDCDDLWGRVEDDFEDYVEGRKKNPIVFEEIARLRARLADALTSHAEAIVEEYEAANEPVVVFCCHRAPVERIGARPGWALIEGGIDPDKRTQIQDDFQAGRLKGVACTIGAGGVSLTLTRASHGLFIDRDWNPSANAQARDRLRRIGTKQAVLIRRLIADHPMERRLAEILDRKTEIVNASIEAARVKPGEQVLNAAQAGEKALAMLQGQDEAAQEAAKRAAEADAAFQAQLAALQAELAAKEAERAARRQRDRTESKEQRKERLFREGVERAVGRCREASQAEHSERRPAKDARERWAAEALASLAEMDSDYARDENSMGFGKTDTYPGHALAQLANGEGCTEAEWRYAFVLTTRYRRQVGEPPAAEPEIAGEAQEGPQEGQGAPQSAPERADGLGQGGEAPGAAQDEPKANSPEDVGYTAGTTRGR